MLTFRAKLTISFLLALALIIAIDNYFIYKFNFNAQFQDLRSKLKSMSAIASLSVDADKLMNVPLSRYGMASAQYQEIARELFQIKKLNPDIKYIYTIAKTDKAGIWRFIVDPHPGAVDSGPFKGASSFPGDLYDVSGVPEMVSAYNGPSADKEIIKDAWGAFLSGYAPIRDKTGNTVAVLGIDVDAGSVYALKRNAILRAVFVFSVGIFLSLILAFFVSKKISRPLNKLTQGVKKIASGNLGFKVDIKGEDEIAQLAHEFNVMAKSLHNANNKLYDYFYGIVQSLVRSLEAKDHYTRGHSDRVSDYSGLIAQEMGLSVKKIELLKKAAQLHDIGKIGVREQILNKAGTLDDEERGIINEHPGVGEEILKPVFDDADMLAAVKSHHEYFDGTGYPEHLKGAEINTFAQIVAVADAFDAMTTSRSYRPAIARQEALEEIKKKSGTQFSPAVVEAFVKIFKD